MSLPEPPWSITEPKPLSKEMLEQYEKLKLRFLNATRRDGKRRKSYQLIEQECARSNLNAFERMHGLTLTHAPSHKILGRR